MSNIQVKTLDYFATRVYLSQLDQLQPHYECWRKIILDMRASDIQPRGKSNHGGWNAPLNLAVNLDFKALTDIVGQLMVNIMKTMTDKVLEHKLSAWVNLHDEGGYNTQHNHAGAYLSCSFYLSVPEGSGDLVLIDPRPGANLLDLEGKETNCKSVKIITPKEGLLVIFPSWLEHRVEPHENIEPRISTAMNLS